MGLDVVLDRCCHSRRAGNAYQGDRVDLGVTSCWTDAADPMKVVAAPWEEMTFWIGVDALHRAGDAYDGGRVDMGVDAVSNDAATLPRGEKRSRPLRLNTNE